MRRIVVERSAHLDSVSLMRISRKVSEMEGIKYAMAAMATDTNLLLVKEAGFAPAEVKGISANDLMIAIDAVDEATLEAALSLVTKEIKGGTGIKPEEVHAPSDLGRMLREYENINLVFISVPGRYAAREAHEAIMAGRHVMIFSDNVSIEDERRLKALASDRGLLLMGPDCGTAIINGVGLGFANKVPRGNVGIVAASGTGAQNVSSLLARWYGQGISQLIGTGGRDVSREIGGIMMKMGLRALIDDAETKVIALISKLPDKKVADEIIGIAEQGTKPCVVYFAGCPESHRAGNLIFTKTLAETALEAACAVGGEAARHVEPVEDGIRKKIRTLRSMLPGSRKFLRGVFSGGTLAQEALFLLGPSLRKIHTNMNMEGFPTLGDPAKSIGHTIVDLGDDVFTRGRAHPMIDQSYRLRRIAKEVIDPQTGVILLDVVLGFGCNEAPGVEIARALIEAYGNTKERTMRPVVIASICGTYEDPQGYVIQKDALESAGAHVTEYNERACMLALEALKVR
jgi:FdrA protein